MMMTFLTLQQYKYFCNIARFQWNIFKIFLQYYYAMRGFIQLRKTWLLFLIANRRILPIFTANYLNIFITNFRLNLVKKNDVTLP